MSEREKREKIWIFEREYSRRDVLKRAGAVGARRRPFGRARGLRRRRRGPHSGRRADRGDAARRRPREHLPRRPRRRHRRQPRRAARSRPAERLRIGHVGGGKAENFNPAIGSTFIDASRYLNLYDPLVRVLPDYSLAPALATEWTPNADSTVWTIDAA